MTTPTPKQTREATKGLVHSGEDALHVDAESGTENLPASWREGYRPFVQPPNGDTLPFALWFAIGCLQSVESYFEPGSLAETDISDSIELLTAEYAALGKARANRGPRT